MKTFAKTFIALAVTALTLAVLARFSIWLSLAFLLIFAPDIVNVVVADFRRTQRRRIVNGVTAVAQRTATAFRIG